MQKKLEIKDRKGAISLFVLLSALFFLAIVTAVSVSVRNKESTIDNQLNKIKNSYEVNVGNEEAIYNQKINEPWPEGVVFQNKKLEFDGTNQVDTGIKLFDAKNINKNFEVTLTFPETLITNVGQATLVNSIDESQENIWPGFCVRFTSGTTSANLEIVSGSKRTALSNYLRKKIENF